MSASPDAVQKALEQAAPNGRLSCERALQLASELGVPAREIGKAADALGIKIKACQLGCFK